MVLPTRGGIGVEVFSSPAFTSIIQDLRRTCDYVLIDGPPVRSLLERRELSSQVDGLVVVGSPADLATGAFEETLRAAEGRRIVGCLINEVAGE